MLDRLKNTVRSFLNSPKPAKPAAETHPAAPVVIMKDNIALPDGKKQVIVSSEGIRISSPQGEKLSVVLMDDDGMGLVNVDEEIRQQITRKLTLLVPELAQSHKNELLEHVFQVLAILANDQLPRIRQMIAEELSDIYNAPLELVRRLAWDEHLSVSAPILEFSPLLSDQDLLDIISQSKIPGVAEVISRRQEINEQVSGALVRHVTMDAQPEETLSASGTQVITNLLGNKNARLSENTLDIIIDKAKNYEVWHSTLINRPELTVRTVNKIARFVSSSMIHEMQERGMISPALGENLSLAVAGRLQSPHRDREKEAEKQAQELFTLGSLDNELVIEYIEAGDKEFIVAALCLLADVPKTVVRSIFESDDPKAITALTRKADLPMRTAIQLQLKIARVHYTKILYAKNGQDFPLEETEMQRILKEYIRKAT
jgi:uncharacterized protein (DUF2336 family)